MTAFSARRYLALFFPFLPADRLHRSQRRSGAPADRPLVVLAKAKSALRIVHADRRALSLGLAPGLTLADARARVPELDIEEEDEAADCALLARIADWCDRYTPLVGLDGDDGLVLDITGCVHLFGGEAPLRRDMTQRLEKMGFTVQSAIAGTPDAARALARYANGGVVPPGGEANAVRPLPIAALGLDPERVTALARAGLKRIADLADRPRAPLAARFGKDLLDRLARTLGEIDHPISPRRPLPDFCAERRFAEPVGRADDISATLADLACDLVPVLAGAGQGGRLFEASFFRADGAVRRIDVISGRPLREPKTIVRLFSEKLDSLADPVDPGFGFDMIRLAVLNSQNVLPAQAGLDGRANDEEAVAELVDRLGARFGPARIIRHVPQDSHLPERAAAAVPAISDASGTGTWSLPAEGDPPLRPVSLFDPPEPVEDILSEIPDGPPVRFRWRRVMHHILRAEGPERIAPEWWRTPAAPGRDYFRVEDREGRRFWLFREGLYGRDDPRWFLHGLFA